jgi:hypothetical protein
MEEQKHGAFNAIQKVRTIARTNTALVGGAN